MLQKKINNIHFILLLLVSCFPLWSMRMSAFFSALFVLYAIILGLKYYNSIQWNKYHQLLILIFPFILIFIRTVFIDQTEEAYFYMERSLSLLFFPLAFFLFPINHTEKQKNTIKFIYIAATTLTILYGEVATFIQFFIDKNAGKWDGVENIFNDPRYSFFIRTHFEQTVSLHPTYACLFLGVAFIWLMHFFIENYSSLSKLKSIGLLFVLFLIIIEQVVLAARTPFVATVFAAFILFIILLKNKIYILWAFLAIIILSVSMYFLVPSFANRFKEISTKNVVMPTAQNFDSFNIRTGIYTCGVEVLKKNWLTGIGPSNVQKNLDECYVKISREVYEGKDYNTHNQFIDYWIGLGILAPFSLLFILIYISYQNIKNRNFVPFAFSILFLIAMFTENILVRQHGVLLFSFIIGLYAFVNKKVKTN